MSDSWGDVQKRRCWQTSSIERSLLAEYKSLLQERELALQLFQFMIHDKFDPAHEMNLYSKLDVVPSSPAVMLRFKVLPQRAHKARDLILPKAGPRNSKAADPNGLAVNSLQGWQRLGILGLVPSAAMSPEA